jgi:hypothetical protein
MACRNELSSTNSITSSTNACNYVKTNHAIWPVIQRIFHEIIGPNSPYFDDFFFFQIIRFLC